MRGEKWGLVLAVVGFWALVGCGGSTGGDAGGGEAAEGGETSEEEGASGGDEGAVCGPEIPCATGFECIHEQCMADSGDEGGRALLPGEGEACSDDGSCPEGMDCVLHVCTVPGHGESGEETGDGETSGGGQALPLLEVTGIPEGWEDFEPYFSQHVRVFGVNVFATEQVDPVKVLHAAHVLAQYLDNDENGVPDDAKVVTSMVGQPGGSSMVMFASEQDLETSGIFESNLPENYTVQDLYEAETHPEGSSISGGFDATLEEVLHLVTSQGWSKTYPTVFGEEPGTSLTNAMDAARGGHFMSVPSNYPEGSWYHYDDTTCDYRCMATEYFYWALTSGLGAQDYAGRCEEIGHEWEPCTKALLEEMDSSIHKLLFGQEFALPRNLPDGSYGS